MLTKAVAAKDCKIAQFDERSWRYQLNYSFFEKEG
jgi:hypothetical protein